MSTRSVIARKTESGFCGTYHHWDGYPEGLGLTLLRKIDDEYNGSVSAMLADIVDPHPKGWSTLNNRKTSAAECYCHTRGEGSEGMPEFTNLNSADYGCEYAYVFDESYNTLTVVSSYSTRGGGKMVGMFGMGDPESVWLPIAIINLSDPQRFAIMESACEPLPT